MAAKIGILGESTVVTQGSTTTVYTVPADKAARIRVLFVMESPADANQKYNVLIGNPGTQVTVHKALGSNVDTWSGLHVESTPNPALSLVARVAGFQEASEIPQIDRFDSTREWVLSPLPFDYFLSTGDTVRFHIVGTDALFHLIQVYGVEDDA